MPVNGSRVQRSASIYSEVQLPANVRKVNIEHQMLGRDGVVVEGKESNGSGGSGSGSITREDRQFENKKAADLA